MRPNAVPQFWFGERVETNDGHRFTVLSIRWETDDEHFDYAEEDCNWYSEDELDHAKED